MEKELLKKLIEVSGLSQIEVSEKTGVPQPHISRWLNDKRTPKLSTIYEMAEKLNYKIDFLITKI